MSNVTRRLRKLLLFFVALLVVILVLVGLSRITTPTAAQSDAVALMERDELPDGPDAFGILYTQGRDVPFNQIAAVLADDAATVAEWPDSWEISSFEPGQGPMDFTDSFVWRLDEFPSLLPSVEDRALFCQIREASSCLQSVRAKPGATAAALTRNESLLKRTQWLRDTEVLRNAMPHSWAPMTGSPGALPLMTARALAFAQRDETTAISETCHDLMMWRRLATNTNMLTFAINGIRIAGEAYARLLADMISEWPVDRPLPDACAAALVPPAAEELLFCNIARGEFEMNQRTLADNQKLTSLYSNWLDRVGAKLLYNDQATVAEFANRWAPYCRTEQPGRQYHDIPNGSQALVRWACLGNLGGCITLALFPVAAYGDYADRLRDFGAQMRLLGALVWMREQAAESGLTADALVDQLPDKLSDPEQRIELAPDGSALRVPLFWDRRGEWAEVPLPAALVPQAL